MQNIINIIKALFFTLTFVLASLVAKSQSLTTTTPTIIGYTTVTVKGNYASFSPAQSIYCDISKNSGFTAIVQSGVLVKSNASGSGALSKAITKLNYNTIYYFRFRNLSGTLISNTTSFTTLNIVQVTDVAFTDVTETTANISWNNGSLPGDNRIVVMKEGSAVDANPSDGSIYTAGSTFTSGDDIDGNGNYVVYNLNGSTVDVDGLTPGTNYFVKVFAYAAVTESNFPMYVVNDATYNPNDFTTLSTPSAAPTIQANNLYSSAIGFTTATLNWTNGNGDKRILVARATTDAEVVPTDGIEYTGNSIFTSAATTGTGNRVVYSGTGSTVSITGLTLGVNYTFKVYEYNGSGVNTLYNINDSVDNPIAFNTLKNEPTVQAHHIIFSSVTGTSMTVGWTRGDAVNNDGCIVVAKANSSIGDTPVDGTTYSADATFGSGGTIGTGEFVVYAGTGTSVNVGGLTAGTTYHFRVFEYNNSGTNINYKTSTATDNPMSQATLGTASWLGTSSVWNTPDNWSTSSIPTSTTQVTIPSGGTMPIISTGNASAYSITINTGASVTVNGMSLTTASDVTVQSGASLQVLGNSSPVSIGGNLTLESSGGSGANGQLVITGTSSFSAANMTLTKEVTSNRHYLMSSPINSPDINDFAGHYVYKWLEGTKTWDNTLNTSSPLAVMEGLNVKQESGDPTSFVFSGTFNNGTLSRTVTNGNTGDNDNGWNLIGNPYPSAIDLEATGLNLNNAGPTFYFYPGSTSWGTYNTLTNASNNGGSQYIPAMQGFFIFSDVTSGSVGFANSMRVANTQSYWKNATIEHPTVKIAIEADNHKTEATVMFYPEGTPEYDSQFDAYIFPGSSSSDDYAQIALVTPNQTKLAVNTFDPSYLSGNVNLEIPIELKSVTNEKITFSSPLIEKIPENIKVYLFDKQENVYTNLRTSNYSYVIPPSTNTRFSLVLSSVALKVVERQLPTFKIYSYQNQITILNENPKSGKTQISIFDISGHKIRSESIQGLSSKTYNITQRGVYIVQVINVDGIVTKKVIIE